jgi:cytochrome c6
MKLDNRFLTYLLAGTLCYCVFSAFADKAEASGASEFKEHCASCHADGGNIVNADKTLSKNDREKNGIKSAQDIIKIMRRPGEGMTTFDEKTVSKKEAKQIADYIIKTFK